MEVGLHHCSGLCVGYTGYVCAWFMFQLFIDEELFWGSTLNFHIVDLIAR